MMSSRCGGLFCFSVVRFWLWGIMWSFVGCPIDHSKSVLQMFFTSLIAVSFLFSLK